MAYLDEDTLRRIGFKSVGSDVRVSVRASIYRPENISLGDRVRIDDFCILSAGAGGITIGSWVHIGCFSSLIGAAPIVLEDFAGLSPRVSIFTSSDDLSGELLTGPVIPPDYRRVIDAPVMLRRHAAVTTGCVVLPGVTIGEGAVVTAMSLVVHDCDPFYFYSGVPARRMRARSRDLLRAAEALRREDFSRDDSR